MNIYILLVQSMFERLISMESARIASISDHFLSFPVTKYIGEESGVLGGREEQRFKVMQFVGKVISSVSEFYRDINPSTLSGAIDVVVVENVETGELACSPFHVRFGKLQLLRPQEKAVELKINGVPVGADLRMKVGEAGETFFVLSRDDLGMGGASDLPMEYLTSPLVGPETPVPLENIEEFKLSGGNGNNKNVTLTMTPTNTNMTSTRPISMSPNKMIPSSIDATSPEWKWEWGDLPIKKSESETIESKNCPELTIELHEFLAGKEYLRKAHELLARFPARSMITRIYRIDRGLHFQPPSTWPDQLASPAFLNESARVIEGDFLLNPNVVIEESSRLLYQFTWENKKVILGGSAGAAVVFYAQAYARILPIEIILKLAEIAAIRMAKRKFSKSALNEVEAEDPSDIDEVEVESEKAIEEIVNVNQNQTGGEGDPSKQKSSWRSWWSRSSAHSTSSSSASLAIPEKEMNSIIIPTSPLITVTGSSGPSSPKTTGTSSPKKTVDIPLATLSSLIESEGIGTNSGVESCGERSPSKQVIHRTASNSSLGAANAIPINLKDNININYNNINYNNANDSDTSCIIESTVPHLEAYSPTSTSTASPTSSQSDVLKLPIDKKSSSAQYIKSLRLPSHLLKRLNLKPGVNTISYTVNTRLQGTATCQSRVFFWRSDTRVVISDIDGTITKSDALGHLFTMVGKDWTHVGVAQLYSKIAGNGYEFLYLTSRAIGQAASTRGYLKGVEQDRLQLPDGPVIMSPDRLFTALHREVIQRRPDEFKIACLRDIQKLFVTDDEEVSMMGSGMISSSEDEYFPLNTKVKLNVTVNLNERIDSRRNDLAQHHQNPFYAGFGNRPTDTKSYKAVGISASRIFLINPAGDLKLDKLTFYTPYTASSYSKLTEEVDKVFPPVRSPSSLTRMAGDEAFTDFQYWHGHDGDVRMDLVQLALSWQKKTTSTALDVVLDDQGKPVSPVTLQKQLGGDISFNDLSGASSSTLPSPELPARKVITKNDGENDADEEEEESDDGTLESIDSFPFI